MENIKLKGAKNVRYFYQMSTQYVQRNNARRSIDKVSEIIKTIINSEKIVLFNCTAGKDRTGIISAILLLILGIDKDTIVKDYMYTNKVSKKVANIIQLFVCLKETKKKQ